MAHRAISRALPEEPPDTQEETPLEGIKRFFAALLIARVLYEDILSRKKLRSHDPSVAHLMTIPLDPMDHRRRVVQLEQYERFVNDLEYLMEDPQLGHFIKVYWRHEDSLIFAAQEAVLETRGSLIGAIRRRGRREAWAATMLEKNNLHVLQTRTIGEVLFEEVMADIDDQYFQHLVESQLAAMLMVTPLRAN